jgi:hypothetical protein
MRAAVGILLLAVASCGSDESAPADEVLLRAHPGGLLVQAIERFDSQADGPVPAFLFEDGIQLARGVSKAAGPGHDGLPMHRWGAWYYYHVFTGSIGPRKDWGHLAQRGTFTDGKRTGSWSFWYPHGKLRAQGSFVDGAMDGDWRVLTADGAVDAEHSGTYRAGARVK